MIPLQGGGVGHYWRDNDNSNLPWHGPNRILTDYKFDAISMIQCNFGPVGNFGLIARAGTKLFHMVIRSDLEQKIRATQGMYMRNLCV